MGTARSFNGSTSRVESTVAALDTGDWTIAGWAFPTGAGGTSNGCIMQVANAGANRQILRFNSATLDLFARQLGSTNATAVTSTLLTLNKWWCLVACYRASDQKTRVYIGDEQTSMVEAAYASQTAGATRSTGGTQLTMGNINGSGNGWAGALCNEVLDGREWSLAEMEYFRRTGRPPSFGSGLRCWFPLEGASGVAAERDRAALVADATITANTGLRAGPTLWLPRTARARRLVRV